MPIYYPNGNQKLNEKNCLKLGDSFFLNRVGLKCRFEV